jgi:hypothetical protein
LRSEGWLCWVHRTKIILKRQLADLSVKRLQFHRRGRIGRIANKDPFRRRE